MARFTIGLLAGIGIGLLIAPEPGEEMRQNLADTASKWRDQFNKLVGKGGAGLEDLRTMLESKIDGLEDAAKSKIAAILDESQSFADKAKQAGKDASSDVKSGAKDVAQDVKSTAQNVKSDVKNATA
jgi:gas vesicle protein